MHDPCALTAAVEDPRLRLLSASRRWYFVQLCAFALRLGTALIPARPHLSAAQQITVLGYSLGIQTRALERALTDWESLGLIERDAAGIHIPILDESALDDRERDDPERDDEDAGRKGRTPSAPRMRRLRAKKAAGAQNNGAQNAPAGAQDASDVTQSVTPVTPDVTRHSSVTGNGHKNGTNVYTSPDSKSMKLTHDSGDVYTLPPLDVTQNVTPPPAASAPATPLPPSAPATVRPELAGLSDEEIEARMPQIDREMRKQMVAAVLEITGARQYRPLWNKLWKHGYRYGLLDRCWNGPDGMLAILEREMKASALPVQNRGGFLSRTLTNLYRDAGAPVAEGTAEEREEVAALARMSLGAGQSVAQAEERTAEGGSQCER